MENFIAYILWILVHLLVLTALVAMVVFMMQVIKEQNNALERLLRMAAFAAGLLAYLGGRAYGISIPEMMTAALSITKPLTLGFWGVIVPSISGTLVAWFCIHLMRDSSDVAARGLVLFSSFVFTMFTDTYGAIATQVTPSSTRLAPPNITFVLGVILYTIFKYKRT